jgi:hypothetical protein
MVSQRAQRRIERWNTLARAGTGVVVLGVVGKSAAPLGAVVALIGLVAAPLAIVVGASVLLLGIAAWWGSARAVSSRVELSTGRAMWMMWCIPTWSAIGDLLDAF